jgi:hypothetical protein
MAITRLGGANAITGTLPAANINDTSIGNITALPAGVGGKVLQVVNASFSGDSSNTTSTSFVDTANILNITPLSSNSKIIVFFRRCSINCSRFWEQRIDLRLIETVTSTTISDKRYIGQDGTGHSKFNIPVNLSGTFTNSSTAQKTFKMQLRKAEANATESGEINPNWYTGATHTISAMEIEI